MSTDWVASSCTLPTAEQPLRVAEFDQLFAAAVRGVERVGPTQLRLLLDASAEEAARELTDRETSCCSFFAFTFTPDGEGRVVLEVSVPAARSGVLEALAVRASTAAGLPA